MKAPAEWRVPLSLRILALLTEAGRGLSTSQTAARLNASREHTVNILGALRRRGLITRTCDRSSRGNVVPFTSVWSPTDEGAQACADALSMWSAFLNDEPLPLEEDAADNPG